MAGTTCSHILGPCDLTLELGWQHVDGSLLATVAVPHSQTLDYLDDFLTLTFCAFEPGVSDRYNLWPLFKANVFESLKNV